MDKYPTLSNEALKAIRDTTFSGGTYEGLSFIRCGRKLKPGQAYRLAREIRAATGDSQLQVTDAHNPEFAEHDYLRISTDSATYRYICQLKS